jgi:glycine/D-amino acid oxidase-like deaminating enzyme
VQHRVAMREGAAPRVLAREAHGAPSAAASRSASALGRAQSSGRSPRRHLGRCSSSFRSWDADGSRGQRGLRAQQLRERCRGTPCRRRPCRVGPPR